MTRLVGPDHVARKKHVLQAAGKASGHELASKGKTAPVHRRQVIEREPAQLLNLTGLGPHLTTTDCPGEDCEQERATVGKSYHAANLDIEPGLLAHLADRGFLQRFAWACHAARQCPQPQPVRLFHQENTTVLDKEDEGGEIGRPRWCPDDHAPRLTMGGARRGRYRVPRLTTPRRRRTTSRADQAAWLSASDSGWVALATCTFVRLMRVMG